MIELTIKENIKYKGCPACKTIKKEFESFLWWFEREGYHEISSLNSLKESSFICSKHAEKIKILKDKLNNTFEFLIKNDTQILLLLKEGGIRKRKKLLKTDFKCRFCEEEKRIEELTINMLSKNKNLIDLYINSPSLLCKKHLFMLLKEINDQETAEKVINKTLDFFNRESFALKKFFDKLDYLSEEKPDREKEEYLNILNFYASKY